MPGRNGFKAKATARVRQGTNVLDGTSLTVEGSSLRVGSGQGPDAARAARIAEIKAQIKNGTYRPNLEKVAERLLPDLFSDLG